MTAARFSWWVAQTDIGDRSVRVERDGVGFAAWFGPSRAEGADEEAAVRALASALGWRLVGGPAAEGGGDAP